MSHGGHQTNNMRLRLQHVRIPLEGIVTATLCVCTPGPSLFTDGTLAATPNAGFIIHTICRCKLVAAFLSRNTRYICVM